MTLENEGQHADAVLDYLLSELQDGTVYVKVKVSSFLLLSYSCQFLARIWGCEARHIQRACKPSNGQTVFLGGLPREAGKKAYKLQALLNLTSELA